MDQSLRLCLARCLLISAVSVLAACATAPEQSSPDYREWMARADASADAGRVRKALDQYHRAAAANPPRKEPWQRIASLNFEAGRPLPALAAVEKVLQRDPSDPLANDMYIASGLQVAALTLQRLRAAGAMPGAHENDIARELVRQLVQLFGADNVIPDELIAHRIRDAVERGRNAMAREMKSAPHEEVPEPTRDPLEVLGGD